MILFFKQFTSTLATLQQILQLSLSPSQRRHRPSELGKLKSLKFPAITPTGNKDNKGNGRAAEKCRPITIRAVVIRAVDPLSIIRHSNFKMLMLWGLTRHGGLDFWLRQTLTTCMPIVGLRFSIKVSTMTFLKPSLLIPTFLRCKVTRDSNYLAWGVDSFFLDPSIHRFIIFGSFNFFFFLTRHRYDFWTTEVNKNRRRW